MAAVLLQDQQLQRPGRLRVDIDRVAVVAADNGDGDVDTATAAVFYGICTFFSRSNSLHLLEHVGDHSSGRVWLPTLPLPPPPTGFTLSSSSSIATGLFLSIHARIKVGRGRQSSRWGVASELESASTRGAVVVVAPPW
ncbi:hypothetical protein E2562_034654 [Oryza meyeriana var. granulata]|uniref:Uncharacterized protein n=1 Tax=Oryza meyeriana var. granulata TaxID=110450 RepID=A0A6G1ECL1_9ORYZ|nr:hypothetical protein E2562_034654 [Oryza meyeriana var. granulata]